MIVSSNSFEDNGMIPVKYTGYGEDISPELRIDDIPEDAASLAMIMDDLDVPGRELFTHWIIWNIPVTGVVSEGLPKGARITELSDACQGIAWGKHCYRGPKPPFFMKKPHRYVFRVYAVDCKLDISVKSDRKGLLDAMTGHILAESVLTGLFGNRP